MNHVRCSVKFILYVSINLQHCHIVSQINWINWFHININWDERRKTYMHKWWAFVIQQSLIMYLVNLPSPSGLRIQRELFLIFLIYHRHLTSVRDKHRNLDCYTGYVPQFQMPIIHSQHRGNFRYRYPAENYETLVNSTSVRNSVVETAKTTWLL